MCCHQGIKILEISMMQTEEKSLASRCYAAEYTIAMCLDHAVTNDKKLKERLESNLHAEEFLAQKNIVVQKKSMKRKNSVEVDIKPMIHYLNLCLVDNNMFISTELSAGSSLNLSPELLMEAFMAFYEFQIPRETIEVLRTDLLL
jgi:hypothetical protein